MSDMNRSAIPTLALAVGLMAVAAPPPPAAASELTSFAPVVEKVVPSVVTIYSTKNGKRDMGFPQFPGFPFFGEPPQPRGGRGERLFGLGSGVIASPDGYIITNNHVIEDADEITVSVADEKKKYTAKVVGADPRTDIAVLKIEATGLSAITFGESAKLRVGDIVLAIGSPLALRQSVSMGIVSAVGRGGLGIVNYENFIQTDAAINMGNSGGPLVDAEGRLVGINTAISSRTGGNEGVGFSVPSDLAREVYDKIRKEGHVVRGYLGISLQDLDPELAQELGVKSEQGALVTEVLPKTPAAEAGIKNGDVILAVNGKPLADSRALQFAIGDLAPGTKVELTAMRSGQEEKISVKLAQLPDEDARLAGRGGAPDEDMPNALDGIAVGDITPELRRQLELPKNLEGGAVITAVAPDAEGFEAGLREGDVVLEINREPVANAAEAIAASRRIGKGENVLLRIYSGRSIRYVIVKDTE